jgi:hypothetical protein
MKKTIYKIILLSFIIIVFGSCKNNDNPVTSSDNWNLIYCLDRDSLYMNHYIDTNLNYNNTTSIKIDYSLEENISSSDSIYFGVTTFHVGMETFPFYLIRRINSNTGNITEEKILTSNSTYNNNGNPVNISIGVFAQGEWGNYTGYVIVKNLKIYKKE